MNLTGFGSRMADLSNPFGVRRSGRHDHFQPGAVGNPGFQFVAVLATGPEAGAAFHAHNQGKRRFPAGQVVLKLLHRINYFP